jgi:hypothetical protein
MKGHVARLALVAVIAVVIGVTGAAAGAATGTLYVSAQHGSDANPCTASAPCKTIGHAVAIASRGQSIVVLQGTYHETVTITKQLSVSGQGATINASGMINGVVISGGGAEGASLRGFRIVDAIGEGVLAVSTSRLIIEHNLLANNDHGHDTPVTPECATNGQVPGDCGEALHLMSVKNSRVIANEITHNIGGILITDEVGPSSGNWVANNNSHDNAEDCGITLPSHNPNAVANPKAGGVYDNTIINNVSSYNGGAGVGMFAPFPGAASYNNHVIGNTTIGNGEAGIAIHSHAPGQNVSGSTIVGNYVAGNGVDPDANTEHPVGIALFSAVDETTVTVAMNHIADEFWGVFIRGPVHVIGLNTDVFAPSVTHPFGP